MQYLYNSIAVPVYSTVLHSIVQGAAYFYSSGGSVTSSIQGLSFDKSSSTNTIALTNFAWDHVGIYQDVDGSTFSGALGMDATASQNSTLHAAFKNEIL